MRDVAAVVQRGEMVRQIAAEIETMIVELGVDARLLRLQLDEVFTSLDDELELVHRRLPDAHRRATRARLDGDAPPRPRVCACWRGCRACPTSRPTAIVDHFGELAKLLRATADDIAGVPGISRQDGARGEGHARPAHREHHPRSVHLTARPALGQAGRYGVVTPGCVAVERAPGRRRPA